MCDRYKETRYIPEGEEWPPNQSKSIVSVALIHYKGKRTQQELIAIAQRHKDGSIGVDKLLSSSSHISPTKRQHLDHSRITKDIADIFTADPMDQTEGNNDLNKPPKCILIEGAPGIGKTVLAKEIAYRWANKEILLHIELIFLVYLRHPRLREIDSVKQLLQLFTSTKTAVDVADYLQEYNGNGVAFVIDGFDEYPASLQRRSFIVDIISGKILHKAMVVVTSRPTATVSLHDQVDRRIDILGFAKEEREQYIMQSLRNSPEKKVELCKYLKRQPTINSFCYVPLHLAILLYLFQQGGRLPETLTEMNESFIIHTIYRYLKQHVEPSLGVLCKLLDLPKPILDVICKLSQIAFNGLQENQLVFTLDEITKMCPDIKDKPEVVNGFGLLQAVQHYPQEGAGETASFNFLHYTMQEFLAAFHVYTLSDEKQSSLMEKTFWEERFNFMWMMYVGIVGAKSRLFTDFISKGNVYKKKSGLKVSHEIQNDKRKRLHVFQCYTEANSRAEVPNIIASMFKDGKIKITDITLLPNHVSSLVSFLSHSLITLKELKIKNCNYGDIGMNILEQFITDSVDTTCTLEYVDLMGNNSSPWNLYCSVIKQCTVSSLTLCGDYGMDGLISNIENIFLTSITLQSLTLCEIGNVGLNIIKILLINKKIFYLKELNLSWRNVTTKEAKVLLQTKFPKSNEIADSSVSKSVTVNILWDGTDNSESDSLNLSGQYIGDGVLFVAFGLYNNRIVCILDISNNKISSLGAQEIAKALCDNQTLQTLNIPHNIIYADGTKAIAEALHKNRTLQNLDISDNNVHVEGAKAIAGALHENRALKNLDVSNNYLRVEGTKVIAEALHENNTLQRLDISNNSICDNGAKAISECIKKNSTLQQLIISGNFILTKGTRQIAEAIDINTALRKLDISNNRILNDGATCISDCLKHNSSLQELDLSENEITDMGVKELSEAIRINMALLKLNISKNWITAEGIVYFLEKARSNCVLQSLNITHNNITKCGLIKIENCIKNLSFPLKVYASWNAIKDENVAVLKLTLSCLFKIHDDTIEYSDIKEVEWPICNISNFEYRSAFLSDCLKEDNTLQVLKLQKNKIFTHQSSSTANLLMIAKAIQINTTIQTLDMSCNSMSNSGAVAISGAIKSNKSLKELDLGNNNITEVGAKVISEATEVTTTLQKLILNGNKIFDNGAESISDSLKINESLQELNLGGNKITEKGAEKISEAIKVTTTLKRLNLQANKISDNGAAAISDSLKSNISLQELNLSLNNITEKGAEKISEAITVTRTLQILNLSINKISDNGTAAISESLKINRSLQELHLERNQITEVGATEMSETIKVTTTLQKLNLYGNKICDDGATAISDSLKINKSLQDFNLGCNNITVKGAKKISEAIEATTTLQKLNLYYNKMSDDGAAAINDSLKSNRLLQEFDLGHNNITKKGAKKISEAIEVTTTLRILNLYNNKISDDGTAAISDSLKSNRSLQELNLGRNNITEKGAKKISEAIQGTPILKTLNLWFNKISDDGAAAISDSLRINKSLQELNLKSNCITGKGAKCIAEAIQVTKTLKIVILSDNKISDDGVAAISDSLKINRSLQELDLQENNITDKGAKKISEAIQVTTTLQKLNLNRNKISTDGTAAINNSLKINVSLQQFQLDCDTKRKKSFK